MPPKRLIGLDDCLERHELLVGQFGAQHLIIVLICIVGDTISGAVDGTPAADRGGLTPCEQLGNVGAKPLRQAEDRVVGRRHLSVLDLGKRRRRQSASSRQFVEGQTIFLPQLAQGFGNRTPGSRPRRCVQWYEIIGHRVRVLCGVYFFWL